LVIVLAVAAGPWPELAPGWVLGLLGVVLAALADLGLSLRRCAPPEVSAPSVVRMAKDRRAHIPLTFTHGRSDTVRLRFGIGLPGGFEEVETERMVDLPAGAAKARIEWPCLPKQRGRFTGLVACTETASVLDLWRLRRRSQPACELRVYPNLFADRRALASIFLDRSLAGAKQQRLVGRGREFEKLREYLPGDGYDEIHWKATAKRGRPITKVFQTERTQEIHVVIDISRLSGRRIRHEETDMSVLDRQLAATLVLLLAAQRHGDHFGLFVYDDRVRVSLHAGNGAGHYGACREALYNLQPSEATPDMAEVIRHLRTVLRRRALLFFLTDLSDPVLAEDFARNIQLLARQHLVMVNQLRAPGIAPLFSSPVETQDEIATHLAGHARWAENRALAQTLRPLGVACHLLEDETLAAELVSQYLMVKNRQAL
jgi:uncharacterized protein (DUF58 family)